jgi:hypothetical protein
LTANSTAHVKVVSSIGNLGNIKINEFGHCFGFSPNLNIISATKLANNTPIVNGEVVFEDKLTSLLMDTTYYFRSYIILPNNQVYQSNIRSIRLKTHKLLTLTPSLINANKELKMEGKFMQLGIDSIMEYGFCWSTSTSMPSVNDNRIPINSAPQQNITFSSNYIKTTTDVLPHYIRCYVIFGNSVAYGNIQNITY